MSTLMKRVMEILQVKQLRTSPYHPESNGMLERFHATLKAMLRKTSEERREWDTYLPYVCFAFRDSTHTATGFSPFQLLFGRDIRGPLSLLYDQLSEKTSGTMAVTEYVEGLKERLREAGNWLQNEMRKPRGHLRSTTTRSRFTLVSNHELTI